MNKIILKHSQVAGRVPVDLDVGELGINAEDGIIYFRNAEGRLHSIGATPITLKDVTLFLLCSVFTTWLAVGTFLLLQMIVKV
ncbi:hypothetical protein UFOVP116_208 [uncultured Caudovirales phage]|uniref:Uncharacterized protein n=1 Tax=uncultured Caudovirales phage TaxID=2100421 RepID=A0A6J5LA74_9CAUD|nr:hypothetical protein UFOVP116_208 [uncultured Caudovirales phage]